MLLAFLLSLANPAPFRLRRLGYVRESGLLHARSRRCRRAWAPHLARARDVVARSAAECANWRLAVVLGSGLLDDVPLADLAARFARVRLVDVVHPWPARLAVRRYPNVELVTAEISAGLAEPALAEALRGADFVVSANIVSQLPIVPIDAYERAGQAVPPLLGAGLVDAHLSALTEAARRGTRVCLITDTVQREEDREGRVTETFDVLYGIALPAPAEAWDWELAPFGEVARHRRTLHRVHAYPDWGFAARHGDGFVRLGTDPRTVAPPVGWHRGMG